jgi:alkylhydroperoxidase family enzyme
MARIRDVSDEDATPEQRRLFEGDRALFGEVLNPSRIYAHRPEAFLAVQALHAALAHARTLPPRLVELARLRVAQLHASPF